MAKLRMRVLWLLVLAAACTPAAPAQVTAQRRKVALVLSGGGARGASHIGVLRVFEKAGIPIHCITGTSFGALTGGLYSIGYSADEIEKILTSQDWSRIFSDAPERRLIPLVERRNSRYQAELAFKDWVPQLPMGIRGGQRLTEALDELTTSRMLNAQYDFDKLPIQFRAVTTNLLDGKAYVFSRGSMSEALRASMAVPLLFTPLEKDGMLLVDGGLSDNLPTDVARNLGADIVIAVDATSPLLKKDEINSFLEVVDQSISLQMERNEEESRKRASIVLHPRLEEFSNTAYDSFVEISKRGEEEAYKRLDEVKALVKGIPPGAPVILPPPASTLPTIESISFRGLQKVQLGQLHSDIEVKPGDVVDPSAIGKDVGRLYATRLFESVGYTLEPLPDHRYQLVYSVRETPLNSLGAGLRFDNDYKFVVLAEFTARQLFKSPSTAVVSAQFGGLDYDFAALRYIPSSAPFFFIEPRGEVMRLQRLDIRDKEFVDRFTDKREGGRLLLGGTLFNQLEIAAGYRSERVRIDEGTEPNRLNGSQVLAGFTFRLSRDTLDFRDFPRSGMTLRLQIDRRSKWLGGDLDYSKWEADYRHYFRLSRQSTLQIQAGAGYSRGAIPFYDLFYIGGYSFSQIASRQFVGLERDELTARQMGIIGAAYRRLLFSRSLSFIRRGYIAGIYNGVFSSLRESSPYNFDLLHGGGLGLHLDTAIGAVRATGGWAEGGRWNFYFTFGPSF